LILARVAFNSALSCRTSGSVAALRVAEATEKAVMLVAHPPGNDRARPGRGQRRVSIGG